MGTEATLPPSLYEMRAALDRAAAAVAAERVVSAGEVHAQLQRTITAAAPEQPGNS
jgi:hypothetical protein